jgi:hypothetical protein
VTRAAVAALIVVVAAANARAQQSSSIAPVEHGRFEVGLGPLWIGSATFGTRDATETTSTGSPFSLFSTTTALNAVTGIEARFGMRLTERLDVEAAGSYAGPHLVTTVRSDSEAGPGPFTSEEWVQQFTAGGDVLWRFAPLRSHQRWTPFAIAGAQYMRQLHEGQTLLVAGRLYEGGGGVKYLLGSREHARMKTVGVRADVRAVLRTASDNTDGREHASAAIAATLLVRV